MGFLVPVAAAVAAALGSAVAAVGAVVAGIVATVGAVLATIGTAVAAAATAVWSVVTAIGQTVWAGISNLATGIASVVTGNVGTLAAATDAATFGAVVEVGAFQAVFGVTIGGYVSAIAAGLQNFLNAIHFKTLLKIHEIAYLVSGQYRQLINGAYRSIAQLSDQLGLGAGFMVLAFRNARSLVLNTSSLLGRRYDIGEITWLSTWNEAMSRVRDRAEVYRNNPGELLQDIDDLVTRPSIDTQANAMQTIYTTLESSLDAVNKIVLTVGTIGGDLQNLVGQLPSFIRKEIQPAVNGVLQHIQTWIDQTYKPYTQTLDKILSTLTEAEEKTRDNLRGIVQRLRYPGDYLREIDNLSNFERLRQEQVIYEVTTRRERDTASQWDEFFAPATERFNRLTEALKLRLPPPAWLIPEVEAPFTPAGVEPEPRASWFVGDY